MNEKAKAYQKDYEELCSKHGLQLIAVPSYKLRDDGTFSLILTYSLSEYKTRKEEVITNANGEISQQEHEGAVQG